MQHSRSRKRTDQPINRSGDDCSFDIAASCFEALDSPVSLSMFLLLKYKEWDQIATRAIDPLHYNDHVRFADDYLAVSILRKADHLPTSFDRKEIALRNFRTVEEHVGRVNREITKLRWFPNWDYKRSDLISRISAICHRILGDSPDTKRIERAIGFGPGASSSCRRSNGHAYGKVGSRLDSTSLLKPLAHWLVNGQPLWSSAFLNADGPASILSSEIVEVRGAKLQVVPKDAKTHRVIAVEPHVNITLQRALGQEIERKLRYYGVNLRDQSRNQRLAQRGYDCGFSTIDLSNASDCVSTELMREVLPPDWFQALNIARSHYVNIEGEWVHLEKFSTAGCGFTFPLETLVFLAICKAASGRFPLHVYGDDIIVHDEHFDCIIEALKSMGFQANPQKSFSADHPFRESCGEDFFLGKGVRPFFVRGPVKALSHRISLHNQIYRYALRRNNGFGLDDRFHQVLRDLRGRSRLLVPYSIGDAGFAATFEEASKAGNARSIGEGHQGWYVRGLLQRPYRKEMRRYYAAVFQSFTSITSRSLDAFGFEESKPTSGEVLSGTGASWNVATIPVMEWIATDTFDISFVSSLD